MQNKADKSNFGQQLRPVPVCQEVGAHLPLDILVGPAVSSFEIYTSTLQILIDSHRSPGAYTVFPANFQEDVLWV